MADVNTLIKLELTIGEVNNILRSLGKHPFEEISALILKIQTQGNPQASANGDPATEAGTAQAE